MPKSFISLFATFHWKARVPTAGERDSDGKMWMLNKYNLFENKWPVARTQNHHQYYYDYFYCGNALLLLSFVVLFCFVFDFFPSHVI